KQVDALTPLLKEGAAESADIIAKVLAENPSLATTATGPKYPITTDIDCDECGKPMIIRKGRRGPFMGCSGYPKCKNTAEVPAKLIDEMGLNANGKADAPAAKITPEPIDHEDAA